MKQKTTISAFLTGILGAAFLLSSCLTSSGKLPDAGSNSTANASQGRTQRTNAPLFTGDGGKGIVIAVPTPVMRNSTTADNWMPQLFQDLITGDIARYSAMTVLDRVNEKLVMAEQELSASGNYSEDDYIRMGALTNARFIVAGNIINTSGRYSVSFRINNTETNEIKASFNKPYSIDNIENGTAAKEAVLELLAGMGVELTEAGEQSLLAIQPIEARATAQLARGAMAESNNNLVEALAFYTEAAGILPTMKEASDRIQNFNGTFQTTNIRERTEYAQQQMERWRKIFIDLRKYLDNNLPIIIYDFSVIQDKIATVGNSMSVRFTISPGIKVVPNRTAILVHKTVMDNWEHVKNREENKFWVNSLRTESQVSLPHERYDAYYITIGLYDDYGDLIKTSTINYMSRHLYNSKPPQVVAQHKYYDENKFKEVETMLIPVEKITDTITPGIIEAGFISLGNTRLNMKLNPPIMTVAEWQEWLALQGNSR